MEDDLARAEFASEKLLTELVGDEAAEPAANLIDLGDGIEDFVLRYWFWCTGTKMGALDTGTWTVGAIGANGTKGSSFLSFDLSGANPT